MVPVMANISFKRTAQPPLNSSVSLNTMRIGSELQHVDLAVLERSSVGAPNEGDVRVQVDIALGQFGGSYDSVWLEGPKLDEFVEGLVQLERNRSGEALLHSTSPDEFTLKLRSRDNLGHIVVEVALQRHQYSGPTYWPTKVSGGFELDPTELPVIVRQFQKLAGG